NGIECVPGIAELRFPAVSVGARAGRHDPGYIAREFRGEYVWAALAGGKPFCPGRVVVPHGGRREPDAHDPGDDVSHGGRRSGEVRKKARATGLICYREPKTRIIVLRSEVNGVALELFDGEEDGGG